MRKKTTRTSESERLVRDIKRKTRKQYGAQKLPFSGIRARRPLGGHPLHADRNRQAERRQSAKVAHPCSHKHSGHKVLRPRHAPAVEL